ncbi:MAG: cupin domain-containing protein [Pseudomonadota bacterium]
MPQPTRVDAAAQPDELLDPPGRGSIRFRTLISAPATNTSDIVFGVAMLAPGETFALHSHPQPEVYFGLEGTEEVMIDGVPHRLGPGIALYIPGGAVHGVPVAKGHLKWAFTFAADSLADIQYSYPHETSDD